MYVYVCILLRQSITEVLPTHTSVSRHNQIYCGGNRQVLVPVHMNKHLRVDFNTLSKVITVRRDLLAGC